MPKICVLTGFVFLLIMALFVGEPSLNSQINNEKEVSCNEYRQRYQSKIGTNLAWLMKMREQNRLADDWKDIVQRETVDVSIRFKKELDATQLKKFETLGLNFKRLPGGAPAKSGSIYGAKIHWEDIGTLVKSDEVVRIESTWKPKMEFPSPMKTNPDNKGGAR